MPPSFSFSVGMPPVTVTASLNLSVRVTVLPGARLPVPGYDSGAGRQTEITVGMLDGGLMVALKVEETELLLPAVSEAVAVN